MIRGRKRRKTTQMEKELTRWKMVRKIMRK